MREDLNDHHGQQAEFSRPAPTPAFFGAIAASQDYLSHTDFKNRSIQSVKNAVEMSLKSKTCAKY